MNNLKIYNGQSFQIQWLHGRWLVNDKRLQDLNEEEQNFMNDFFREVRVGKIVDLKVA